MIFGTGIYAQDFDTYDMDRDNRWTQDEFDEMNNNNYDDWDADRDGYIDEDEFADRTYYNLDRNRDNFIDEDEWDEGINTNAAAYLRADDFDVF